MLWISENEMVQQSSRPTVFSLIVCLSRLFHYLVLSSDSLYVFFTFFYRREWVQMGGDAVEPAEIHLILGFYVMANGSIISPVGELVGDRAW